MIQLVTHYVELKKTYSKGFEFLFAPALGDNSGAQFTLGNSQSGGGVVSEITGTISNFIPKLNWLKSHGYGRVLESESIIVKDKNPASFSSGGQFFITNSSANGTTNTPVNYGLTTKITPKIAGEGRSDSIELNINFSFTVPNFQTNPPTVSKNEIITIIDCRSGQSAAVGGLITSQSGTAFNDPSRLPAGQDPIIRLFASKDFQSNQSQFVVFITPAIKASASSNAEKVKRKFKLRD
jgi:pilus assembly protein CpaC